MPLKTGAFPFGAFPSGAFPPGAWPTAPIFPVSLDDMKIHLRVIGDTDDFLIRDLILAATSWAEMFQRRFYISRAAYMYLDSFTDVIRPVYSPLVEVGSIKYIDSGNVLQLLADTDYRVDTETAPGRIEPAWTMDWPQTIAVTNAVIIEYTAGYGAAADVPDDIKAAIKLLVGHWYEDRIPVEQLKYEQVPAAAISLLWRRRLVAC